MLVHVVMTVMIVVVAFVALAIVYRIIALRGFGRFQWGVVFEGVGGAQRFAFRAQIARQQS
jgi:hypothetical protein